jgi:hypothetical protein
MEKKKIKILDELQKHVTECQKPLYKRMECQDSVKTGSFLLGLATSCFFFTPFGCGIAAATSAAGYFKTGCWNEVEI